MVKRALVVIDVQEGIFSLPQPVHAAEEFLENVENLLDKARKSDTPIVFVQHNGAAGHPLEKGNAGWKLHPRLARKDHEFLIQKSQPDSFQGSRLDDVLRDIGAQEIVVCGFASPYCVDTTVRSAYAKGYKVRLASDAHSTTANPVLDGAKTVAYHNWALTRFADVLPAAEIQF